MHDYMLWIWELQYMERTLLVTKIYDFEDSAEEFIKTQ